MWVKICGNTNLEDAQQAAAAGADALGFVFAPSPRLVTREQVKHIVPHLPKGVETYGVFVNASVDEIARTVLDCGLSGVQLHARNDAQSAAGLRREFECLQIEKTKIITVLTLDDILQQRLEAAAAGVDAVLVDSRSATQGGGTGKRWDWAAGAAAVRTAAGKVRIVAAGGLDPTNVREAIEVLQPWGVDVVTGVEASPGRKDWRRVEAFIASAKAARSVLQAVPAGS